MTHAFQFATNSNCGWYMQDVEDPLQMLIRAYRVVWTGGDVYGVPSGSASKTRD